MTHNRTMFPAERSSMTDQLGLWSHQALFNGIRGLIYWKYRPFIRGRQVAGRGLTTHTGEPGHLASQAARAAAFSARFSDLLASCAPDHAGAAILHDHDAQDLYASVQEWDRSFYVEAHRGIFRGFWEHGISPRYLTPADLETGVPHDVRVLAIPCNVCLARPMAAALLAFVRRGGVLFTEGRFGLLSPDGYLHPHVPGHDLHSALGVAEVHFTSDARDRVLLDGGSALDIDDYLQELELGPTARVLLTSEKARPVLVESPIGGGAYLHAAFLLGRAIQRGAPGALRVFDAAFARLQGALTPAVTVHEKPGMVDVSVLLDEQGRAKLVGVCNYRHVASRVELSGPPPRAIDGDPGVRCEETPRGFALEVPPREAVALLM